MAQVKGQRGLRLGGRLPRPPAEFSDRVGYTAVMIACLLGAVGSAYGVAVGTFVGFSTWEWLTIPLMGVVSVSIAVLLWRTGDRYLTPISVFIVAWLSFHLLSNLTNSLYISRQLHDAFIFLPWFPVLFAFIVALFRGRLGIHLCWIIYSGVAVILLRAAYVESGLSMADGWTAAVVISLIALPTFITLLYAVAAFREHFAATQARSRLLQEHNQKLEHLAYHDTLTGLANRMLLERQVRKHVSEASDTTGVAVHHVDLDDFKDINDSHGHGAGDYVLRILGERLRRLVYDQDDVARTNADEFVIIQRSADIERVSAELGRQILETVAQPIHTAGAEFRLNASIGTAIWRMPVARKQLEPEQAASELLSQADLAMLAAKQSGGNAQRLFQPVMLEAADRRLELRTSLRRALAYREFVLHYQPQLDMLTGKLVGVEALIRWDDPLHGLRSPAEFIPAAEESGIITEIGEWALREACRAAASWPSDDLKVEVNISPVQLDRSNLVATVRQALQSSGLAPQRLELELTEGVFTRADDDGIRRTFQRLKDIGVGLVVDDFGTGYSSLLYLKHFPITMMKIDRAFISGLQPGSTDHAIIKAIITLARAMRVDVVAEGIETEQQRELLLQEGCRLAQGFLYARPMTEEAFLARYFPQQERAPLTRFSAPPAPED